MAIILLCSHLQLNNNTIPFEPKEWNDIMLRLKTNKMYPEDILELSVNDFKSILNFDDNLIERIKQLLSRSGSISFELEKLWNRNIGIITSADNNYPKLIKQKLILNHPPLFYYTGELKLLDNEGIAIVGSRNIDNAAIEFTKDLVENAVENDYMVISGGARGIDNTSEGAALGCGGKVISILSDSLGTKIKNRDVIEYIEDGRLLLLSATNPSAGFSVGFAMGRNKYVYTSSVAAFVISSDYDKGGTWAGATENLKNGWVPTFVRKVEYLKGNMELIKKGAIAIENIDFENIINKISNNKLLPSQPVIIKKKDLNVQLSLGL